MDFVDFNLAKKLKEKGFPQVKIGTLAMYNEEGEWYSLARNLDEFEYLFEDFDYHDCVCPTISQVLKWLREEKKIAINIEFIPYTWQYKVIDMSFERRFEPCGITLFSDYEEAAIAGIEYCLNNLI